jgi:hypothetical protein
MGWEKCCYRAEGLNRCPKITGFAIPVTITGFMRYGEKRRMEIGIRLIPVGVTRPRHGDTRNRIRPGVFRLVTCVGFVEGIGGCRNEI